MEYLHADLNLGSALQFLPDPLSLLSDIPQLTFDDVSRPQSAIEQKPVQGFLSGKVSVGVQSTSHKIIRGYNQEGRDRGKHLFILVQQIVHT